MTQKRLTDRRRRNAELAALDRSNRCIVCKIAIRAGGGFARVVGGRIGDRYCSQDCIDVDVYLDQEQPSRSRR
jgi:hypothetical protein